MVAESDGINDPERNLIPIHRLVESMSGWVAAIQFPNILFTVLGHDRGIAHAIVAHGIAAKLHIPARKEQAIGIVGFDLALEFARVHDVSLVGM